MIEKWEMVSAPSEKDKNRHKISIKGNEQELAVLMRKIGNICGRPFVPVGEEYNWAFYVYGVEEGEKSRLENLFKNFSEEGEEDTSSQVMTVESGGEMGQEKEEDGFPAKRPEERETPGKEVPLTVSGEKPFWELRLIPQYTFENFVVGPNSRFTHAAAKAVAEKPGLVYNPLFIYGGVGLGKTHLMHAVGHFIREAHPEHKILYVTTEKFISEVIEAIHKGTLQEFRDRYRSLDLLMVDDIQFLSESEQTQEEFFHTFNILHDAQKQIIITSDRPPKQLLTLEDRLRSRFEWGLIADIKSPNLETRVAILKNKAQLAGVKMDDESMMYIAGKLKSNIRELEGFIKRVDAYAKLTNQQVSLKLVKELMQDLLPEEEIPPSPEREAMAFLSGEGVSCPWGSVCL